MQKSASTRGPRSRGIVSPSLPGRSAGLALTWCLGLAVLLWMAPAAAQPTVDPDWDGISGSADLCPDVAEDFDGWKDEDGCPDVDNDTDGVSDIADLCPNDREDVDGFQDGDGCPDLDNDADAVLDVDDACPNEPEVYNGIDDDDGCPDETASTGTETYGQLEISAGRILTEPLQFHTTSHALLPDSLPIVEDIAQYLEEHPEWTLRIEVHTDSSGSSAFNLRTSQERADAIRDVLVVRGVDAARITPVGVGEARPIAPNTTAQGREQNRRVEFYLEPVE